MHNRNPITSAERRGDGKTVLERMHGYRCDPGGIHAKLVYLGTRFLRPRAKGGAYPRIFARTVTL